MRIGCHLSVAKGYAAAVARAPGLGANCFQYFTKNPRGFRNAKPVDQADAARGRELLAQEDVVTIGHAPYLINLASPDDELYHLSIEALVGDLVVAEARGSYGVVVHCGKGKDRDRAWALARMQEALATVLGRYSGPVRLLLENTAGQRSEIGTTLEELLLLAEPFAPERLGFCFDTQHAFAAGVVPDGEVTAFPGFAEPRYLDRLGAIHLNDSMVPFGARRDRHELIGQGFIGPRRIRAVLADPRLQTVPFYLETPVAKEAQYADEIRTCHALLAGDPDALALTNRDAPAEGGARIPE
ncbi:MAG: deoxyribonuclease IV [Firmicutes bacterium]|nr:deoxyribonuclease IV [Bacillota bacterium]